MGKSARHFKAKNPKRRVRLPKHCHFVAIHVATLVATFVGSFVATLVASFVASFVGSFVAIFVGSFVVPFEPLTSSKASPISFGEELFLEHTPSG